MLKGIGILVTLMGILFGLLSMKFKPSDGTGYPGTIPPGSVGIPILGETLDILTGEPNWFLKKYEKYGPVSRSYGFGADTIILSGYEGAKIFYDDDKIIRDNHQPSFLTKILPNNVANKNGEEHREAKAVVNAALTSDVIDHAMPQIVTSLRKVLSAVRGRTDVILKDELLSWNFNALCYVLFSNVDYSMKDTYIKFVNGAVNAPPIDLPFTEFGKAVRSLPSIIVWLEKQIEEHIKHPTKYEKDGLSAMLNANSKIKHPLSINSLAYELNHIFAAGLIVGSPALFFIQHIQSHPADLTKLKAELLSSDYNSKTGLLEQDLKNFTLLNSFYLESRRMSPGVKFATGSSRISFDYVTNEGVKYHIPKGWWILLSPLTVGFDAGHHKHPEEFDSRRFLGETDTHVQEKMEVIAQGAGSTPKGKHSGHGCPGWKLAGRLVRTVFIELVLGYEWKLNNPASPPSNDIISMPKDGGVISL
jgi:cytochrome P450